MKAEIWGTPVAYEERGEGMPLVAIHGWTGCCLQMTERLEPVFADLPGYRRIYLDLPRMASATASSAFSAAGALAWGAVSLSPP